MVMASLYLWAYRSNPNQYEAPLALKVSYVGLNGWQIQPNRLKLVQHLEFLPGLDHNDSFAQA